MKTLAIKGDVKRGNEVITLLEMLGGKNVCNLDGKHAILWISNKNNYMCNKLLELEDTPNFEIFTLDEFYKKYPYKVKDKVVFIRYGGTREYRIIKMRWNGEEVVYTLNDLQIEVTASDLELVKTEAKSGIVVGATVKDGKCEMLNIGCFAEKEIELYLGDYKIEVRDGKTYAVKKKTVYPKTYEECCNIMCPYTITNDFRDCRHNKIEGHKCNILTKVQRLLVCRDAYWKIAGEQMGLDKPWEPIYTNLSNDIKYNIEVNKGILTRSTCADVNKFLVFPTAEMCDTFLENFRELIESCKEFI